MNTRQIPVPNCSVTIDAHTIFPRHQYLLQPEDRVLISGRLRGWFYNKTARRYIDVPHAGYERGVTIEGTQIRYTPMHYDKFKKNVPQISITSHSKDLTEILTRDLRETVLEPLHDEILAKYNLSPNIPNPIPPLPGFEYMFEKTYRF